MSGDIRLVVQSDDFGMCHAVNEGIVRAFSDGILTQATCMVPCPWFDEAASLALSHSIPVGMHSTLTAEWDHLRWRPITAAASIRGEDGTFHRTIADARTAQVPDATDELLAQAERFVQAGLTPIHVDCHMGIVHPDAYAAAARKLGVPFLYELPDVGSQWDSRSGLSHREDKVDWLVAWIEALQPGRHLLVTHCAADSPELDALARRDAENYPWTRPYRISDLGALIDPRVRDAVERRGAQLTAL